MHECDKVKDYQSMSNCGQKLVLLKKAGKGNKVLERTDNTKTGSSNETDMFETIAVYSVWTSWTKLPDNAERCERCARYRILNKRGYCSECENHLKHEAERTR